MAHASDCLAASRRPSLSSERGSFLVEVMVGAIVLAIVTFAVLDGMSGAADTGERNRQRSVASTLAQQDIERLRSFEITDLSNYRETRTVNDGRRRLHGRLENRLGAGRERPDQLHERRHQGRVPEGHLDGLVAGLRGAPRARGQPADAGAGSVQLDVRDGGDQAHRPRRQPPRRTSASPWTARATSPTPPTTSAARSSA